jgi:thiamine monophosphate synthase
MLGGINIKNIKKIKLANAHGIAGVRFANNLEKFVNYFNLIY